LNFKFISLTLTAGIIFSAMIAGCVKTEPVKSQKNQIQKPDSAVAEVKIEQPLKKEVQAPKEKQKKEIVIHEEFNSELWDNVVNKDLKKTKESLEKGADVNARAFGEWTPLMRAVSDRNLDMSKLLIEHGADVNAREKNNNPVIAFACGSNNIDLIKLLLKNKALANVKNSEGTPVLLVSSSYGLEPVKLLVEKGADVNKPDLNGKTALMVAASYGRTDVVKYLLEKGADVNAKMTDGSTALSITKNNIGKEMPEVRKLLKEAGAE